MFELSVPEMTSSVQSLAEPSCGEVIATVATGTGADVKVCVIDATTVLPSSASCSTVSVCSPSGTST